MLYIHASCISFVKVAVASYSKDGCAFFEIKLIKYRTKITTLACSCLTSVIFYFVWYCAQQNKNQPQFRSEYNVYSTFQSHEPEFDYLKSLEIEEKINKIRWLPQKNAAQFLLSTNGKLVIQEVHTRFLKMLKHCCTGLCGLKGGRLTPLSTVKYLTTPNIKLGSGQVLYMTLLLYKVKETACCHHKLSRKARLLNWLLNKCIVRYLLTYLC